MDENIQEYIDILVSLEPVVKQAGRLMVEMRQTAASRNKFNTGIAGIDIVTEADEAVQELILSEMLKTKLAECQIFAEENTPSVKKFKGTNGLTLSLDPIDGTALYASTGRFFCTIIYLRKGGNLLYSFYHYPLFNWSRRITKNGVDDFGKIPDVNIKNNLDLSKTIVYTFRSPQKFAPEIYEELSAKGYNFACFADITNDSGSATLFFLNKTAGYFTATPNPYDGLGVLHYAQAKNFQTHSTLDLSKMTFNDHGPHCAGWYLVLQK